MAERVRVRPINGQSVTEEVRDIVRERWPELEITDVPSVELVGPRNEGGRPVGRPESRRSVLTRWIAERALERGESPLHVMLENLQWFKNRAAEIERELGEVPDNPTIHEQAIFNRKLKALLTVRMLAEDCAKDAAPYCHPRLNSINVERDKPHEPIILVLDENDAKC